MAIVRSDRHELSKCRLVLEPEHSPTTDDPLFDAGRSGTDRGDLSHVDERPTIRQELIHNILGGSPFAVRKNFGYSHPNEIISSRHDKDSQQGDIEDCDPLIPVTQIQTRLTQLPVDPIQIHRSWGVIGVVA